MREIGKQIVAHEAGTTFLDQGLVGIHEDHVLFFRHAAGPVYRLAIRGASHANFTDTSISSPSLRWLGALGDIDGHRMLEILNVYVPAFFDRYLLGEPAFGLESNSADFPEVELESRNVGS